MAKNVMKLLKPSPKLGKNGFDLSHRQLFSANIGELIPSLCVETVPDDDIEIRVSDLLRCQPLVTSPFMRVKQHVDLWFVPYQALWSRWNEFITSREEPSSSALKYANHCPHFNLRGLKTAISNCTMPDVFGSVTNFKTNAWRLLDMLGYPTYDKYFNVSTLANDNVDVNPWRLLAYQYIWYHEYRQKYYDNGGLGFSSSVLSQDIASLFNVDFASCSTFATADILTQFTASKSYNSEGLQNALCQMRYRCWKKDLFTGILPSTQFGNVSQVDGSFTDYVKIEDSSYWTVNFDILHGRRVSASGDELIVKQSNNVAEGPLYVDGPVVLDVLSLRRSQALQIWRENALRAGNQVQDNYRAHYGVEPNSHIHEHPVYIGSVDAPLNISDVDVTSSNSDTGVVNNKAGDIAGKGVSSLDGNRTFKFHSSDFGVIMGIFSLLPEAEYNSTGIDRMNQLNEQFDYFFPEFENLGLEAVDNFNFDLNNTAAVLGYAPRYFGYKQKLDLAHLDFMYAPTGTSLNGLFRAWASPKYMLVNSPGLTQIRNFYVAPFFFNQNFVNSASNVPQFICDVYNDVKAVRPLSVTGMPKS